MVLVRGLDAAQARLLSVVARFEVEHIGVLLGAAGALHELIGNTPQIGDVLRRQHVGHDDVTIALIARDILVCDHFVSSAACQFSELQHGQSQLTHR